MKRPVNSMISRYNRMLTIPLLHHFSASTLNERINKNRDNFEGFVELLGIFCYGFIWADSICPMRGEECYKVDRRKVMDDRRDCSI